MTVEQMRKKLEGRCGFYVVHGVTLLENGHPLFLAFHSAKNEVGCMSYQFCVRLEDASAWKTSRGAENAIVKAGLLRKVVIRSFISE